MDKVKPIDIATYVLTEEDKRRGRISERAYRRGYHHGFIQAKLKKNKVSEEDIEYWRYQYPIEESLFGPDVRLSEIRELRKKSEEA